MDNKRILLKNTTYAFIAQVVSLMLSMMIALFVPKVLNIKNFGYWQLYLFYFSYVGFFNFGLNDGIYLKYGGTKYNELPNDKLGEQFKLSVFYQSIIAILFILFAIINISDSDRQFVMCIIAITMVVNNLALYLGYIFQATNETSWFSLSVILDKVFLLFLIIIFIAFRIDNFRAYVCLYVVGRLIAFAYCSVKGRSIVFSHSHINKNSINELFDNIAIGVNLMFANIASMFIVGFARFIIDNKWGIETFGKFSLAISIEGFILLFIGQISMVIFPVLRRISAEKQSEIYKLIRDVLSVILPIAFILYPIVALILKIWLPQYSDSIVYLGLLLPICTYDGKMNLLCTTYFKVLRKEKFLLAINIYAMIMSLFFGLFGAYSLDSIMAVAVGLVVAVALRSIISEMYLAKLMNNSIIKDIIFESILVAVFMFASYNYSLIKVFVVMVIVYFVYIIINTNKIKYLVLMLLKLKK